MSSVVKVYTRDGMGSAYYFINGVRSDAYDDRSALAELLGESFQEFAVVEETRSLSGEEEEVLSQMECAETLDEFAAIAEENEHLIEEI